MRTMKLLLQNSKLLNVNMKFENWDEEDLQINLDEDDRLDLDDFELDLGSPETSPVRRHVRMLRKTSHRWLSPNEIYR